MAQIQPERALECIFAGRYEKIALLLAFSRQRAPFL